LPDCWLVVSMHPEGPATGHLDTGFLGFPLSSSKCWDVSQIPSCYCMLLMQPSLSKFIKITPCSRATKLVNFQIISTLGNESWNKILPSLSQAFLPILTSSLPFYPYQKDERAWPGYLQTRCSFSRSYIKRLTLSPRCYLFTSRPQTSCEEWPQQVPCLSVSRHAISLTAIIHEGCPRFWPVITEWKPECKAGSICCTKHFKLYLFYRK
jgi:hypothetical protein